MKFIKLISTLFFMSILIGCSSKYQQPENIQTPVQGLTKQQVKKAILDVSKQDNFSFGVWKLEAIDDNTIHGRLLNRKFQADVNIPYSAQGYSINFVSVSSNLKDKNGKVHRNYNRWIKNLDKKIQDNIFLEK